MTRRRNRIARAVCVALLVFMFAASGLVAYELVHPHVCTGDACEICHFIAQVEQVCCGLGLLLLALLLVWMVWTQNRAKLVFRGTGLPVCGTLVSCKIRLND